MTIESDRAGKGLNIALWVAQALVGAMFLSGAFMKLGMPIPQLAKIMPWVQEVDPALVLFTGIVDGLGGIGILLPALARIQPRLTVYAAIGCAMLQVCAFVFHVSRGDPSAASGTNVVLFLLATFVAWGRSSRASIASR
jgi:hypothetical protein